jgi:hypothetical protein
MWLTPDRTVDFFLVADNDQPDAFSAMKIASFIFRPDCVSGFYPLPFQFEFGKLPLDLAPKVRSLSSSRARFRPPGNIHGPPRHLRTSSTRPRFTAMSFDDLAISGSGGRAGAATERSTNILNAAIVQSPTGSSFLVRRAPIAPG